MKKQKKLIALSSLAVMGLGRLSANRLRQKSRDEVPSQRKLTGNESIHLSEPRFARNADGTFTETVHYSLQPAGITGISFYTTLDWVQDDNSTFDWATVDNTKKVEDYVTYSRDTVAQTISFTCKKEFGRPLRFDRAVQEDTSKTAEIQIDYSRKRLEKAKVIRNVEEFTDNKPVFIKIQDAKWSIGSTGSTKETERVEVGYKGEPISALLGQIQEPNSSGYISYLGGTYTTAAGLRVARAEKFSSYLKDCISDDNPTCFQKSHLKEIGTYSYTHFGTRNSMTNFINNYRAAAERGNGFYVKVTVADEIIYNKVINFSNQVDRLDSLTIDQSAIVF
mgnify:CR=1 FL=1